jgi:adhesin/invasin
VNALAIADNATVTFTAGTASGSTTTIDASPGSITADGASTSTVTVTVRDANSNVRTSGGEAVVLNSTLGGLSVVTDNANGTYTATLTAGTTSGTATITGTVNALAITDNATVTFTAGAAANMVIQVGDGQIGLVGGSVAAAPAVRVTDTFDNPVAGVPVTFSVTGGGGTVSGATPTTGDDGVAAVTSWVVRDTATMSDAGTLPNTLNATSAAGTVTFNASAIYSYTTHVQPIWDASCIGCHGEGGTLPLLVAPSRGNLADQNASCDALFKRVGLGGGATAEAASVLVAKMDGTTLGACPGVMPTGGALSEATRNVVRAWIRNGAPDN